MDTVLYSKEEKIRLLVANGYVVREEKVTNFSRDSFAYRTEKRNDINTVFDSTVKNILLMVNPEGGEEGSGFYTQGKGIDIQGKVISLSHLGFENLTNPGADKMLFWDNTAGALGWADFEDVSDKIKISLNDTTPDYLEDKLGLSYGENAANILELGTINEGANEILRFQFDENKISQQIHTLATSGPHTDSLPLADLAPGTAGDIITRQTTDWAVLSKGTEDYVLTMGVTYPVWAAPTPAIHALGGTRHSADTLANLNTKISDATLYEWENDQGAVNIHGNNVIYGSAVSTACVGNDSRLSNARVPTAHASSHLSSGADTIVNFTSTVSGLVPLSGGGTTKYLRADGTWAAPSTEGISFGADNQIPYTNAGGDDFDYSANFVFTATGLGIGTASPVSALHINNNTALGWGYDNVKGSVTIGDKSGGSLVVRMPGLDTGGWYAGFGVDGDYSTGVTTVNLRALGVASTNTIFKSNIAFYTTIANVQYERMSILANGNVGIGTASPSYPLDISDSDTIGINYTSSAHAFVRVNGAVASASGYSLYKDNVQKASVYVPASSNDLRFSVAGDRMTIRADTGRIGIGITAPVTELEVVGDIRSNWVLGRSDLSIGGYNKTRYMNFDDNGDIWIMGGNVGINDLTPSYKLDVNGTGRFTGILHCNSHIYQGDNDVHYFGTGHDGQIYHNGTRLIIGSTLHGAHIDLIGENEAGVNKPLIYTDPDGAVTLYHAGSSKLATSATGVTITGALEVTGGGSYGAVVTGITPTLDAHLATKKYVDDTSAIAYGSAGEIPLTNNTGDGFLYHSNFAYDFATHILHMGGGIHVHGPIEGQDYMRAGDFLLPSDIQLKKNVVIVRNGLDIALSLRPVHYDWKDNRDDFDHIGFIAQDMKKIRPELVRESGGFKNIGYSTITAINNAAIHVLNDKVESNKEKIIRLEKRIKELENGCS